MSILKKKTVILLFSTILLTTMLPYRLMNQDNLSEQERATAVEGDQGNIKVQREEDGKSSNILKVSVFVDSSQFAVLQSVSRDFEKQHTGIQVLLNNLPASEAYEDFKALSRIGEAPDVMLLENTWVNEFAVNGYLSHEADKYFTSDFLARNLEPMLNQVKWNSFIWAVPSSVDPYIFVWNQRRFAEKKLDRPPSTVSELIQINPIFQDAADQYGLYFDPEDPFAFITLVRTLGGNKLQGKNQGSPLPINNQTLEWLKQILTKPGQSGQNKALDFPMFANGMELWERLNQGDISMAIVRASEFVQFASEHPDSGLAVASLPKLQADASLTTQLEGQVISTMLEGTSFGVSSHSKVVQDAFEWIRAVTSSRQQDGSINRNGVFPAYTSLYDAPPFTSIPDFKRIKEAIRYGSVLDADPKLPDKLTKTRSYMKELFHGALDLGQFGNVFNQQWDLIVDADS